MKWAMAVVLALAGSLQDQQAQDYANLLKDSKLGLAEGISTALKESKKGIAYKAELEGDKTVHWAVDVSKGDKVLAVDIDAKSGAVVGTDLENADQSALAKSAKVSLLKAVEAASDLLERTGLKRLDRRDGPTFTLSLWMGSTAPDGCPECLGKK